MSYTAARARGTGSAVETPMSDSVPCDLDKKKDARSPVAANKSQGSLELVREMLFMPIPAHGICTFRMMFGVVMFMQTAKFGDVFTKFKETSMVFPYGGLGYFPPVNPEVGDALLLLLASSSICTMLGLFTRLSCVLNFVLFTYVFHICESNHNNHYILFCHVTFATIWLDWGTCLSVDSYLRTKVYPEISRKIRGRPTDVRSSDAVICQLPTVPWWQVFMMQILFNIPYFYGAIAKMNYDWIFRAQPPKLWFSRREGWMFEQWWFPWFIAWGGTAFDLGISFVLWYKPTRYILGFPNAIFFHCMNKYMFNIGVFPIVMTCALVLFVEPIAVSRFWAAVRNDRTALLLVNNWEDRAREGTHRAAVDADADVDADGDADVEGADEHIPKTSKRPRMRMRQASTMVFLSMLAIFHALFPLRHFVLYPDSPSWTEEGHHGAWHMMLRTKRGWGLLEAVDDTGDRMVIDPTRDPTLNDRQTRKVVQRPHMLLLYVAHLQKVYKAAGRKLDTVHVHSCFTLNARPLQRYYVDTANALDYVGKYESLGTTLVGKWIEPLASISSPVPMSLQCEENLHQASAQLIPGSAVNPRHKFLRLLREAGLAWEEGPVLHNRSQFAYTLYEYPRNSAISSSSLVF